MLMVDPDPDLVEQRLLSCELKCPVCLGVLRPWFYARWRTVRGLLGAVIRFRPRRSRCRQCSRTHVLLPDTTLLRRAYSVDVISVALMGRADGWGHRKIARSLGVPAGTVRGWLRRFTVHAGYWRQVFTGLRYRLDSVPGPIQAQDSPFGDVVEVIGLAGSAAIRCQAFSGTVWQFASVASGGLLLSPNPTFGLASSRASPGVR
jgi:hypothetical protein